MLKLRKLTGLRLLAVISLVWSAPVRAADNYIPTDFSLLTDDLVRSLVKTVGIGTDHRAYSPATPLGIALGIEIGLDVTAISLPSDFKSAIVLTSGVAADSVPDIVPVPRVQIRKGLPYGVDLGFSYSRITSGGSTLYTTIGGDLQWAFIRNRIKLPALAIRASYAAEKLFFISSHQFSFDLIASKKLFIIDPYIGAGVQVWSGELEVPAGIPTGSVALTQSGTTPRIFAGLPLKLLILKFTGEASYSLEKVVTYGGKISFSF